MKLTKSVVLGLIFGLFISFNASAWWGNNGNNNGWGNNGWGNNWPEWTPMYWMEEMSDGWGGNNWGGNNRGPWGGGYNPYGYGPYGYGSGSVPYGAYPGAYPPPVPYGRY